MNRTEKTQMTEQLVEKFSKANVALFADYKGLTATQADDLRRLLRAQKTEVKVLKNNIARLAAKDGKLGEEAKKLFDEVVGPTMVAFSYGDPSAAAKIFYKFSKDVEAFKLKDSLMGKTRVSTKGVTELAELPPREVLLAKLLGTLNAPVTSFVGVLAAVPRSLLNVLSAVERKKAE